MEEEKWVFDIAVIGEAKDLDAFEDTIFKKEDRKYCLYYSDFRDLRRNYDWESEKKLNGKGRIYSGYITARFSCDYLDEPPEPLVENYTLPEVLQHLNLTMEVLCSHFIEDYFPMFDFEQYIVRNGSPTLIESDTYMICSKELLLLMCEKDDTDEYVGWHWDESEWNDPCPVLYAPKPMPDDFTII